MIQPVNNQCLIEVIDEYSGLAHSGGEQQRGVVKLTAVSMLHLTASTGFEFSQDVMDRVAIEVDSWIGKTVRYALYADADSSRFTEDGKSYVLLPWYRVLGVETEDAGK